MSKGNILVISSGGDAPGMNAAIRAVVRSGLYHQFNIYGCEMGYCGLLERKLFPLHADSVANCIQRGGTLLKTGRCKEFFNVDCQRETAHFLQSKNINALIVLGGNGSFAGASALANYGDINVLGIPCTIDNDVYGTEYTIGFDTARNTALMAIDKIRDTAFSLERNFIIEVMGRSSGFLALDVGLAGGAEFILTPEYPIDTDSLVKQIQTSVRTKLTSIIIAAEADQPGHCLQLAQQIEQLSGIQYKVCILGHIQRGGTPSAYDRKVATIMGAQAIDALLAGQNRKMLAMINGQIELQDFPDQQHATRFLQDDRLLKMNHAICRAV